MNEIMILHRGVCHDMNWVSYLAPEEHSFLCFTIFFSLFLVEQKTGILKKVKLWNSLGLTHEGCSAEVLKLHPVSTWEPCRVSIRGLT